MATRSTIGIQNDDETIEAVYCHWDGYLEGVGKTLKENYNSEDKIRQLLSFGNISSLGEDINSSLFYERDRQEKDQKSEILKTQKQLLDFRQEYNYVWINGQWLYYQNNLNFKKL